MKRPELPSEEIDYRYTWLSTLSVKRPKLNSAIAGHFSVYERLFGMNDSSTKLKSAACSDGADSIVNVDIFNPTLDSTILRPAPLSTYGQVTDTNSVPADDILQDSQRFLNRARSIGTPSNYTLNFTSSGGTTSCLSKADLDCGYPVSASGFERQVYQRLLSQATLAERLDSLGGKTQIDAEKKITIVIDDTNSGDTGTIRPVSAGAPSGSTACCRSTDQPAEIVVLAQQQQQRRQALMASAVNNSELAGSWLRRCEQTPFLSDAWMKSLGAGSRRHGSHDAETKRREFDRQLAEAKLYHCSKQVAMSHQQRMDNLEQRLACLLLTPPVLNDPYLEPQPIPIELPYRPSAVAKPKAVVPALPVLTDAQLASVKEVMKTGPLDAVLVDNFRLSVTRRELLTLSGTNWLSDMVINFYMQLLSVRSHYQTDGGAVAAAPVKRPALLRPLAVFSTFFYAKLASPSGGGYSGVRRWSRQLKLFDQELVLIPIHDRGMHWCLACVDMVAKTITYYDSMGSANATCLRTLKQYLQDEHLDKKGTPLPDPDSWKLINSEDTVPQQFNGSDCGVFICTFGEFLSRSASFTFSQDDMPAIRERMTFEILNQQLLTTDFRLVVNGK